MQIDGAYSANLGWGSSHASAFQRSILNTWDKETWYKARRPLCHTATCLAYCAINGDGKIAPAGVQLCQRTFEEDSHTHNINKLLYSKILNHFP